MPISEGLNQTLDPLGDTKAVPSKQLVNTTRNMPPITSITAALNETSGARRA